VISIDCENGIVSGYKSEKSTEKSYTSSLWRTTKRNWKIFAENNYTVEWLFFNFH